MAAHSALVRATLATPRMERGTGLMDHRPGAVAVSRELGPLNVERDNVSRHHRGLLVSTGHFIILVPFTQPCQIMNKTSSNR